MSPNHKTQRENLDNKLMSKVDHTSHLSQGQRTMNENLSGNLAKQKQLKVFLQWYQAILFGGEFNNGIKRVQIIKNDSLISNVVVEGKNEQESEKQRKSLAQVILDRLIVIKFLISLGLAPPDMFERLRTLDTSSVSTTLKQSFSNLKTPEAEREGVDPYIDKLPYICGNLLGPVEAELESPDYKVEAKTIHLLLDSLENFRLVGEGDCRDGRTLDTEILGYLFESSMNLEDRKSSGSYYTPKEIADYINQQTIEKRILYEANSLPEVSNKLSDFSGLWNQADQVIMRIYDLMQNLKICDIAIGSGSFILASANVLLKLHNAFIEKLGIKTTESDIRRHIVEKNLFGVDVLAKAVEITKLRLWFWLVSSYTDETGKPPPDICFNIRQGDSLVGLVRVKHLLQQMKSVRKENKHFKTQDYLNEIFLQEKGMTVLGKDRREVLSWPFFHWGLEFRDVFDRINPGFDVIVGNPPYFSFERLSSLNKELLRWYPCHAGHGDLLYYFYNRGLDLLGENGTLGFISSRYFVEATFAKKLRGYLTKNSQLLQLIDLSRGLIFQEVGIHTVIVLLRKVVPKHYLVSVSRCDQVKELSGPLDFLGMPSDTFSSETWVMGARKELELYQKISRATSVRLRDVAIIEMGPKSGKNAVYTVNEPEVETFHLERKFIKPFVKNSDVQPYFIRVRGKIIYTPEGMTEGEAPNIIKYLRGHYDVLRSRAEARDNKIPWWRYQRPRRQELYEAAEKLVVPYRAPENRFAYDNQQLYNESGDVRVVVPTNPAFPAKYLVALLNSTLMNFFYTFIGRPKGRMYEYFVEPLGRIPVVKPDQDTLTEIIDLAEAVLKSESLTQASSLLSQIDGLVYKLYNIFPEEQKYLITALKERMPKRKS